MSIDVLAAAAERVLGQLSAPDHYDDAYPDLKTIADDLEALAERLRRYANNGLPRTQSETFEVESLCKGLLCAGEHHIELRLGTEKLGGWELGQLAG